ncbi:hypothetical protein [Streptacidiphilus jiangxiensis]|uniref:Uncharacterized protein n=1 Tax=Streptacidiphilus jiangxiensis TaxID=235985 RepID=A0A1H7VVI8_STRJI|nr:hypothetical protein [Streptacidiphilus jiangxiensis]SEM13293.1 hypothetical protein SAMN05414137_11931 [Streptacidiphilus jiangxiensis]
MSFTCHAGRTRDRDLPFGLRVSMFRSCVQLYRPLGFHTTIAFLESRTGSVRRDEDSLLAALQLLEQSRAEWTERKAAYAAVRTAAKRDGQRVPPASLRNANRCDRWHADPRAGALFTAGHWQRTHRPLLDPVDETVVAIDRLVTAHLSPALPQPPAAADEIRHLVEALRRRQTQGAYRDAPKEWFARRDLLTVLHHLAVAQETE